MARTGSRQAADRLIDGGCETVLDAHWLQTRTTGISGPQMDTQVESQVGLDALCQFACPVSVCVRGRTHTATSGLSRTSANMSAGGIYQCSYTAPFWMAEELHSVV